MHENLRKYFFEQLEKSKLIRKDIDRLLNNQMSSHYFTNGEQFSIPICEDYKRLQLKIGYFKRDYNSILKEYHSEQKKIGRTTFTYNPCDVEKCCKSYKQNKKQSSIYRLCTTKRGYVQTVTNYPKNLIEIDGIVNGQNRYTLCYNCIYIRWEYVESVTKSV